MQYKRGITLGTIWSALGWSVLATALLLQLLPLFFLSVMVAYGMGLTAGAMLVVGPAMLFATVLAACALAARRSRFAVAAPWPRDRRPAARPARATPDRAIALIKTRDERYRDIADALGAARR